MKHRKSTIKDVHNISLNRSSMLQSYQKKRLEKLEQDQMERKKSEKNLELDLDGVAGDDSSDGNNFMISGNETDNTQVMPQGKPEFDEFEFFMNGL